MRGMGLIASDIDSSALLDFHHIDLLAHFDRERIPGAYLLLCALIAVLGLIQLADVQSASFMPRARVPMGISRSPMTSRI